MRSKRHEHGSSVVITASSTSSSSVLDMLPCAAFLPLQVRVIRGGAELTLSCFDLLVGDVLLVEAGDILPADGLIFAGGQIK
jgi:magnesium-transporting ATPase (P-type)